MVFESKHAGQCTKCGDKRVLDASFVCFCCALDSAYVLHFEDTLRNPEEFKRLFNPKPEVLPCYP